MKHPKPVYLPEPITVAEAERRARWMRGFVILCWAFGLPLVIILILLAMR